MLAYTVLFAYLSLRRRWAMWHFDEDLAIYDQIVWNTSRGRLFASTLIQHADNMLGDHFSPIVAVFAPLYWVRPTPSWLLLGQTAALAAAALPLYAFARPRLGGWAATAVAAAYLTYPALHFVNLFQFHEIALVVLPLSCALLAIDRRRRGWFLAAAVVVLLVKEEAAIVVVGLAVVWLLARRDQRMALATAALGIGTGLLTMGVVLPRFNTADTGYYYVRRYAYLGDSPLEMAWTTLTSPALVVQRLLAPERLRYLAQMFGPLLLLPVVGWQVLAGALPVFGYLLLADSPDQYAIDRHYLSPLLPFLWFGAVLGVQRVGRWAAPALLVGSLAASYLFGPTPVSRAHDPGPDTVTPHTLQLRRFVAEVPPDAPVSANRNLLSWFSRRERVYRFPEVGDARYVVLDFRELRHPAAFGLDGGALGRLVESPDYRLADAADGALFFERGDPGTWPDARPGVATRFGDAAELVDYHVAPDEVLLVWRALTRPAAPYQVFVHVLDARGERIAQRDGPPVDGLLPTDTWPAGRVVPERRRLATSGARVQVGLYDGRDGKRLPVTSRGLPGGPDWAELPASP